ncbi:MAG: S8 family serine peptidase, partial [Anaerolineales bacterium]|nr:S8 family serine peptidase [Anaerolineales bacterium]
MKRNLWKTRSLGTAVIALLCALLLLVTGSVRAGRSETIDAKLSPTLQTQLRSQPQGEMTTVVVTMKERANLSNIPTFNRTIRIRRVINALQTTANTTQEQIKNVLETRRFEGRVSYAQSYWVFNGLVVTATADVIEELAAFPQVESVTENRTINGPAPLAAGSTPEVNIDLVNAPDLWALGYTGQGIVVATMDTGVYASHADLAAQYRGGSNSWFDPYNEFPDGPADLSGHGTATMGVMVGRDAGGTAIGIAPDAQWIAARIFNNQGAATDEAIHASFQWLLDPDGNPNTADTPHVVNNSWTLGFPGCDLTFQGDLQALRAAGILPIFAAGNMGGSSSTSTSPGNNPEAFAVGGTNNLDNLYADSSQGPSTCGEPSTIFPEMVAPAVNIRSTDLFNLYASNTGTSAAAPHVAGALALLLQAYPNLTVAEQEAALINGAVDLGSAGADNLYGNGRLDILAAYQSINPNATPTATPLPPTATNTPLPPTATNTPLPPTATNTPIPPEPTIAYYFSLSNAGPYTVGTLADVGSEDVIGFDGADYVMILDGSDIGLGSTNIDALHVVDADTFLLSLEDPITLGALGTVDDSDIVQFDATSTGTVTSGAFSWYFDGSDVGLSNNGEDIDGLAVLADGRLLISTSSNAFVNGTVGRDEDLLAFTPTTLGEITDGSWAVYFDGSNMALDSSSEDIDAAAIAANGDLHISTWGSLDVTTITAKDEDMVAVTLTNTGENTTVGSYAATLPFDGSLFSIGGNNVNGASILIGGAPAQTATPLPPTNTPLPPTATNTPLPPTATSTPLPPTATSTPLPPTNTPLPPTATNTPLPPTNTPLPPTATSTPLPPTNTPLPPTATSTPLPPTPTNTP